MTNATQRTRAAARHRMLVGRLGEQVAALVLAGHGVETVARNVRSGHGEVDLVCTIDGERVAVEIKTLMAGPGGDDPIIHFDATKRARVRAAALRLEPKAYRVDLVTVVIRPDRVDVRWLPRAA